VISRSLEGRVAVITGATSGIGEATARLFVQEGARVVLAGRNVRRGSALTAELGEHTMFLPVDVRNESSIGQLIDAAVERLGRVDCLFNNAGAPGSGTLDGVTESDFDDTMRLLLGSVVFGIKHAARVMRPAGGGCVINNSSVAANRVGQSGYLYAGAKAAVTHLTRIAAIELGTHNIRVNSISPGAIATPIFWGGSEVADRLDTAENERKQAKLVRNLSRATAFPRAGNVEDIAQAALFLATSGTFITGHDLVVDGGRSWIFHERAPSTDEPRSDG
jgi:NAD(P)-dependent dehydrogenase (short-subunit alcohol dehydrogenase family)